MTPGDVRPLGDVELIDSDSALSQWLADAAEATLLAVDTEAASFHRYQDKVYLL